MALSPGQQDQYAGVYVRGNMGQANNDFLD